MVDGVSREEVCDGPNRLPTRSSLYEFSESVYFGFSSHHLLNPRSKPTKRVSSAECRVLKKDPRNCEATPFPRFVASCAMLGRALPAPEIFSGVDSGAPANSTLYRIGLTLL